MIKISLLGRSRHWLGVMVPQSTGRDAQPVRGPQPARGAPIPQGYHQLAETTGGPNLQGRLQPTGAPSTHGGVPPAHRESPPNPWEALPMRRDAFPKPWGKPWACHQPVGDASNFGGSPRPMIRGAPTSWGHRCPQGGR